MIEKTLPEGPTLRVTWRRLCLAAEKSNNNWRLLCQHADRPCRRRSPEKRDELAA